MNFYFRDGQIKKNEEKLILENHKANLVKDIFVLILSASDWDDYGFKTDFSARLHNLKNGTKYEIGTLKVGYKNQPEVSKTIENQKLKNIITNKLDAEFFSMFNSEESYHSLFNCFEIEYDNLIENEIIEESLSKSKFVKEKVHELLNGLNDIVYTRKITKDKSILEENVFKHSFLRSTSIKTILNSYSDIVFGKIGKTNFELSVKGLDFRSTKDLKPSNNIHALIGSNGCGKSYILDSIVHNYINNNDKRVEKLIIVSFSPFDKLESYKKYLLKENDLKINYIGIKDFYIHINNIEKKVFEKLKDKSEIKNDFIDSYYLAIRQNLELVRYVFDEIRERHPGSQLDLANLDEVLKTNNISFSENKENIIKKYSAIIDNQIYRNYMNDEKLNGYLHYTNNEIIDNLKISILNRREIDIIDKNLLDEDIKNRIITEVVPHV